MKTIEKQKNPNNSTILRNYIMRSNIKNDFEYDEKIKYLVCYISRNAKYNIKYSVHNVHKHPRLILLCEKSRE